MIASQHLTFTQDTNFVRPLSLKELSALYSVSTKTIKRWLQPYHLQIGERNGRFYTTLQVKVIFTLLGWSCPISQMHQMPNKVVLPKVKKAA
jgi:hypothetical protein